MPCTTILVGKDASYDGSCIMARNDDAGAGHFTPKKFVVIQPSEQPIEYESVLSHVKIELPKDPMRYTAVPNIDNEKGIWAACGINEAGVGMSATETITSNPRVLGADPLVVYDPDTNTPGGIGEEDLVYITLPYIHSAREGVERLGKLLEQYGTYEMNGIGFSDTKEVWWLESIGGHHWMARRVPDDAYVAMPNQLGIDYFDFEDAYGKKENFMCSADLKDFTLRWNLDLTLEGPFDPRAAFGSHDDADHVYNTPRAWYIERYLNPNTFVWDGEDPDFSPRSDDIPWCLVPEKKITIEDVKYLLSSHYQGTPYDPYMSYGDRSMAGAYRSIGVNRTSFLGIIQNRPHAKALEWISFGANPFNISVPFYVNVDQTPDYVSNTTASVDTNNFYWVSRLIEAMADASYKESLNIIERYQNVAFAKGHEIINRYDALISKETDPKAKESLCAKANQELADMAQKLSTKTLDQVLYQLSCNMKNAYARSDA